MRLDRLLANLGYGSRRDVKVVLAARRVTVDGVVVKDPSANVADPSSVLVDGEPLDHPHTLVIALHKPLDYVCSHDEREGLRAYDLLPRRWLARTPRIESVGRLDRDTTGLLLLTDDHQLLHRLTSPRHHVAKRYVATLDAQPPADTAARFTAGTLVLDGESTPCQPVVGYGPVAGDGDAPTYELVLTEGRYHQVRRMFAAVGCTVTALHRTDVGSITIGSIALGEHRVLSDVEVVSLRSPSG